jgi:hypothetical protein
MIYDRISDGSLRLVEILNLGAQFGNLRESRSQLLKYCAGERYIASAVSADERIVLNLFGAVRTIHRDALCKIAFSEYPAKVSGQKLAFQNSFPAEDERVFLDSCCRREELWCCAAWE